MRYRRWWMLLILAIVVFVRRGCEHDTLRVATFNIEDYPKSKRQELGAFAVMSSFGAGAIAVQEITEPERFALAAKDQLGASWRFAYPADGPKHRLGVLFDENLFALQSTRIIRETERQGGKASFEARLKPKEGGQVVRMIVVHLKAGGDNVDTRLAQLSALRPVIVEAAKSGDRVVLLGDFNATSDRDRRAIADLAKAARLDWSTEKLPCTSYWDKNDGCVGTPLDHVLSGKGARAKARGPCEIDGCARQDRCPVYVEHISDHCPVTVDLD